jgi:hypothetical protein
MAFKTKPPVRFGNPEDRPASDGKSGQFLSVPKDKMMELKVLVQAKDIPSVDQCALWNFFNPSPVWTYIGDDDPSNDLGIKRGYRAFVPVSYRDEEGQLRVKLWSIPLGVHKQITELDEMSSGLRGLQLRVKKSGAGLKTKYSIISTGKRLKITEQVPSEAEILDLLGPFTRDEIIKVIEQKTGLSWEDVVETVAAKPPPSKSSKAAKFKTVEIEDDELDSGDEEEEAVHDDSDEEAEAPTPTAKKPAKPTTAPIKSPPAPKTTKTAPSKIEVELDEEDDFPTDDDWDADEEDLV